MAFKFAKFKARKDREHVEELYGENAPVMLKTPKIEKKKEKVVHSFPHLLNKRFEVKQLNLPSFDDYSKPRNNYPITERDKVNQLIRNGAKQKTHLDD